MFSYLKWYNSCISIEELLERQKKEEEERIKELKEWERTEEFLRIIEVYYGEWDPFYALMGKYDHIDAGLKFREKFGR